jgi:hypothetical protein
MTDDEWEHHKHKLLSGLVDPLLDGHSPVTHLADDRQAEIDQNAFLPDEQWASNAICNSGDCASRGRTPREHAIALVENLGQGFTGRAREPKKTAPSPQPDLPSQRRQWVFG